MTKFKAIIYKALSFPEGQRFTVEIRGRSPNYQVIRLNIYRIHEMKYISGVPVYKFKKEHGIDSKNLLTGFHIYVEIPANNETYCLGHLVVSETTWIFKPMKWVRDPLGFWLTTAIQDQTELFESPHRYLLINQAGHSPAYP